MTKTFSFTEMLKCAEREIALRKRVYPNRLETKRMSLAQVTHEIACMEAIAEHFRELAEKERLL